MNREQFVGICLQITGKLNETWGEQTGGRLRAVAGKRSQIAGKAQQFSGIVEEESARQLRDFQYRNRNWHV